MTTTSQDATRNVWTLRRGAYGFLRSHAARAWLSGYSDQAWLIDVPPDLEDLPPARRYQQHARQEARRIADAALYVLRPEATARAVAASADLHTAGGIEPPTRTGFLVWEGPSGVGESDPEVPLVACHWGPCQGAGLWVVWWADIRAVGRFYRRQADADAPGAWSAMVGSRGLQEVFGPLFYRDQVSLRTARWPHHVPLDAGIDPALRGLLRTTLATWRMVGVPTGLQTFWTEPPQEEVVADREAGLRPEAALVVSDAPSALMR
ncbi:hypothetical protein [Thermomonospora cellulosilytica]|uniref:Uncharacterized protein n=1 Tax=Thermomonospora cellulosilytica TaxID=1411118 RepID=A0A7W3N1P1_9ACTN|nr:hypothetical protein [Thermomonospora cellulosilytica]MBA9005918.1 hypothetical protein [Thermomonospora cellulosilytica]